METNTFHPLLSVIVPIYNVETYLNRCIESILQQTYSNLEVILVDDGSTDSSGKICDFYAMKDDRVKAIHKKNGGSVSARKEGLAAARGEYAAFVDSDDWIEKNMYAELMPLIYNQDADMVTSGCIRDYGTHCVVQKERIMSGVYEGDSLKRNVWEKMISTVAFFESRITPHLVDKIFKRRLVMEFHAKVDNYINIGDDAACVYPCLLNAGKVVVSGKSYYHYCMRSDSIMGIKKKDEWERYQVLFKELEQECGRYAGKVPDILEQIRMYEYYVLLLQQSHRVIFDREGFLFPFGEIRKEDKIVIYGAGRFGCELNGILKEKRYGNIVACVDRSPKAGVLPVEALDNLEYDKIIIAVLVANVVEEIKEALAARGIDRSKVYSVDCSLLKTTCIKCR